MNIRTRLLSLVTGISIFTWGAPVFCQAENPETKQESKAENTPVERETEKPKENARLYLWKATRGNTTIYLLGTMHFAVSSLYPLPEEIEDAFKKSKHLIVEARIDEVDQNKLGQSIKPLILFTPPDKLSNHISEPTRTAFSDYLKWAGESDKLYENWKPWFVASYVSSSIMKREGLKAELGIDRHFLKKAKETNKTVSQLESVESQLKLLGGFPMDVQDKMLRISLLQLKNSSDNLKLIERCWKEGDADSLARLTLKETDGDPGLTSVQRIIYDERNQSMTAKLLLLLTVPGPHFVAIGAGHLAGEESVLNHLKEHGFAVEQMQSTTRAANTHAIDVDALAARGGPDREPEKFKMNTSSKMSKLHFPEGRFTVLMPGNPEVKYKNESGMRLVDYQYTEAHGTFNISYAIMPRQLPAQAQKQVLDLLSKNIAKSVKGVETGRRPFTYQGVYPGLQVSVGKIQGKPELMAHFRFFVVGRFLYIVGSAGTKEWLASPVVREFINSVAVQRELSASELAAQESKKRHEEFQAGFDARKRKFDQDFRDQQSRNRMQFEGARAAHERMFGRRR